MGSPPVAAAGVAAVGAALDWGGGGGTPDPAPFPEVGALGPEAVPVPAAATAAGGSYCAPAWTPSRSGMEDSWKRSKNCATYTLTTFLSLSLHTHTLIMHL